MNNDQQTTTRVFTIWTCIACTLLFSFIFEIFLIFYNVLIFSDVFNKTIDIYYNKLLSTEGSGIWK